MGETWQQRAARLASDGQRHPETEAMLNQLTEQQRQEWLDKIEKGQPSAD